MEKKAKRIWIGAAALAAAAGIVIVTVSAFSRKTVQASAKTDVLAPMTLQNTVSATGIVESSQTSNVYSTLGTLVEQIHVEVGDRVNEGDLLCVLDTENLQFQISQQEAALGAAANASQQQIDLSQKAYDTAKENYQNGTNSSIVQAQTALATAQNSLRSAEDTLKNLDDSVSDSEKDYVEARNDWKESKEMTALAWETLKNAEKNENMPADRYKEIEAAYQTALQTEEALKMQYESYRQMYRAVDQQYTQAETAVENARANYESAKKQLEVAELSVDQQIDNYADNVETAKISSNQEASRIALQQLKSQLKDASVKAPASGTITAVYAKEGMPGSGLLFVIENTDELRITTTIKEYDVTHTQPGMPVVIKSDATGDSEFAGVLDEIAPTALKAADGSTISSTNVEFQAKVNVTEKDTGLRVGMNTRLQIILEEKQGVYGVPYDAVSERDGQSFIFVVETNEKGEQIAREVPVETGIETDFYIEISGGELADGMEVLSNAEGVQAGARVGMARDRV